MPRESTRVVVSPRIRINEANRQEYENAQNRLNYAIAEGAYHGARFIPATRGITAVGDMVGLNPSAIAQRQVVNTTNITNNVIEKGLKKASNYSTKGVNPYNVAAAANKGLKAVSSYNKANTIAQTYSVAKEIYDANKNLNQVLDKMPRQPMTIDTGTSYSSNQNFNSQFDNSSSINDVLSKKYSRPRRSLGGIY